MSNSRETRRDRLKPRYRPGVQVARLCLVCYLGVLLMLSSLQRQLIYQPTHIPQLPVRESGVRPGSGEDVTVRTADGLELHGWHLMPAPLKAETPAEFDRCLG